MKNDSEFGLRERIEASTIPLHRRVMLVAILDESRSGLEVAIRTQRLAVRLGITRRTAQRQIDQLVAEDKVLTLVQNANSRSPRGGDFRFPATYRLLVDNLRPRITLQEWESQRKRAVPA